MALIEWQIPKEFSSRSAVVNSILTRKLHTQRSDEWKLCSFHCPVYRFQQWTTTDHDCQQFSINAVKQWLKDRWNVSSGRTATTTNVNYTIWVALLYKVVLPSSHRQDGIDSNITNRADILRNAHARHYSADLPPHHNTSAISMLPTVNLIAA